MKHLKKAFCLLLAAVMLLALGVPAMAAGEIPVDAEHFPDQALRDIRDRATAIRTRTTSSRRPSARPCSASTCLK